jgi:hypothetical protein
MSEPINATIFTQRFIDFLEDDTVHPGLYEMQMERKDWGQVALTLVNRKTALAISKLAADKRSDASAISRELLTPKAFNPLGSLGYLMHSIKRPTSPHHILTNLFFKSVGLPYDSNLEADPYAEIKVLYSVLSHSSVPIELQQKAEKTLEQTIPVYQIVAQLAKLSTEGCRSCYEHVVEIQSQECTVYQEKAEIPLPEGPFITWLWSYCKGVEDRTPVPQGQELIQKIAETDNDLCRLIRALALAMSREASAPIERYFEGIFPVNPQQQWSHRYRYAIRFDTSPTVTQTVQSVLLASDPQTSVEWSITIHFDSKFCIDEVQYSILQLQGFDPKIRAEFISPQLWKRPFLGNIERLFHQPDIITFMTHKMWSQSGYFEQTEDGRKVVYVERGVERGKELLPPKLNFLLQSLNIPLSRRQEAFDHRLFDSYIRDFTSPSNLLGVLLSVSHLPFDEVTASIEKSHPPSKQWDHTCSGIEILHHNLEAVIVHHGISTRLGGKRETIGSITWSLKISLSPLGYPLSISFESREKGDIKPLTGISIPQFIPPPYPSQPQAQKHKPPTIAPFIFPPSQGLILNREPLDIQPGIDPMSFLFKKLAGIALQQGEALETHALMHKWLTSCSSSQGQLLRSLAVAFSEIPLTPVVEFLQRMRPIKTGETWEHESVQGEISVDEKVKTATVKRHITSRCMYRYLDLFQKPQSRSLVTVNWELVTQYNLQGKPQESFVKCLSVGGADSPGLFDISQSPFNRREAFIGTWFSLPSQAVEAVFQSPPSLRETITELARIAIPVMVNSELHSKIIVVDDELEFIPGSRSGLEILLERIGTPDELVKAAADQQGFFEQLRAIEKRITAWAPLMKALNLDEIFPCTEANIGAFQSLLVDFLAERDLLWETFAERSKSCPDLPSIQEVFVAPLCDPQTSSTPKRRLSLEKEKRKDDLLRMNEILANLGIDLEQQTSSIPLEFFLEKWRQNDRDIQVTNFPFLLGIAGGQSVISCITNIIEKRINFDSIDAIQPWQHRDSTITVHIKADGGSEITVEGKSMLTEIRARDDGTDEQTEVASITWSLAMRFDANRVLLRTISSVKEICAPSLTTHDVQRILTLLNSTWDSICLQETVYPLVSISEDAYQARYPSPLQHILRLPSPLTSFVNQPQALSFMHNATEFSLNLNPLSSILSRAEDSLSKQYTLQLGSKSPLVGFNHLQSLLFIGSEKEPKLCHSISTFLYHIEEADGKSLVSNVKTLPWKIELILDAEGKTKEVCVSGLEDALLSHEITQECQALLPTHLEPVNFVVSISRNPSRQ